MNKLPLRLKSPMAEIISDEPPLFLRKKKLMMSLCFFLSRLHGHSRAPFNLTGHLILAINGCDMTESGNYNVAMVSWHCGQMKIGLKGLSFGEK